MERAPRQFEANLLHKHQLSQFISQPSRGNVISSFCVLKICIAAQLQLYLNEACIRKEIKSRKRCLSGNVEHQNLQFILGTQMVVLRFAWFMK
jgi:hypothetical protein